MNIEADSMRYDNLKQVSEFTGRVVATKGSIIIRGTRIEVRQDPEGYQHGVVTAEAGGRAYFKQRRDAAGDEWIEGEAEQIEYDGRADTVRFVRRAVMRRLVGTQVNDEASGPLIVYDQSSDTFSINGVPSPSGASPGTTAGRVRAVLAPRSNTQGTSAAPDSLGKGLRSTLRLDSAASGARP